jgi:hypothetical protein
MPMYMRNELMFPPYAIPMLRELRGAEWRQLVDHIMSVPEGHEDALAFSLLMIRLNGCLSCETDGYRAMRGCIVCATQTIRRYKGGDKELVKAFKEARKEVQSFIHKQQSEHKSSPAGLHDGSPQPTA